MSIFDALKESHERQRALSEQLLAAPTPEQKLSVYEALRMELHAHAAAEERNFYMPLMERDSGLDLSRHAIHEHHLMDEMMEDLDEMINKDKVDSENWNEVAGNLSHRVNHHVDEEETKFFPKAREILDDGEIKSLAKAYEEDFAEYQNNNAA